MVNSKSAKRNEYSHNEISWCLNQRDINQHRMKNNNSEV